MPAETPIAVNEPAKATETVTRMPSLILMLRKRSRGRTARIMGAGLRWGEGVRGRSGAGSGSAGERRARRSRSLAPLEIDRIGTGLQRVPDPVHRPDPLRADLAPHGFDMAVDGPRPRGVQPVPDLGEQL